MVLSQFCSDEAVNGLFNFSKHVVDKICSGYERPKELRNIQYLIFAGMVSYYGFEHINVITAAFEKNEFIYTEDDVVTFLEKMGTISKSTLDSLSGDSIAIFLNEYFYSRSTNLYYTSGKVVISNDLNYPPEELLEYVTHEVNHAVNSVNKSIVPVGKRFQTRKGLNIIDYNTGVKRGRFIEEAFNTHQSEDIMDHILAFTEYDVKDSDIKYELDKIRYAVGREHEYRGYPLISSIVKPLYDDGNFNYILKERRIDGNVNFINTEFDSKTYTNSFDTLSKCIDDISIGTEDALVREGQAKALVKSYVTRK